MRTSASQNNSLHRRVRHHKKLPRTAQFDDSLQPPERRELHTLGTHEIARLLREWRRTAIH
jgi:hypothetical protein